LGSDGESVDIKQPVDSTSSAPIVLSPAIWQAKLFYENWHDYNSTDNIAVKVSKFSESDYRFELLNNILAAHWKMNDNANNTAVLDSSGNGNHGTARHATSTMSVSGIIDKALSFNGINDYITIPKESGLITERNNFTIVGWFNLTKINSIQNFIAWKGPSSAVQFVITDGTNNAGIWACSKWLMKIGYPFTIGTWYHIAWSRNGDTWKVYINGNKKGSDIIDSCNLGTPTLNYYIGAEATKPSQFLSGLLDDVRIYNTALTETEIKTLYSEGAGI
jgi:hypothetical protein